MGEDNIKKCVHELSEVVFQLHNANPESSSYAIPSILRLLKCIAFLQAQNFCDQEVDTVNESISLYYMHRAEIDDIVRRIAELAEKMSENA